MPRDDHSSFDFKDGTFLTFGGFVNGSRTGQVIKFKQEGATLNASLLEPSGETSPCFRASLSMGVFENKMFIFGGQDDDNNKLADMWTFDLSTQAWSQVEVG